MTDMKPFLSQVDQKQKPVENVVNLLQLLEEEMTNIADHDHLAAQIKENLKGQALATKFIRENREEQKVLERRMHTHSVETKLLQVRPSAFSFTFREHTVNIR
jgi:hypothetical protein